MRGKNAPRQRNADPNLLQVHDVYATIQGEGPRVGQPAVFIRLSGCHLRCHFCDARWDDEHDRYLSIDSIMEMFDVVWSAHKDIDLAVLTGGEPLRQNVTHLVNRLCDRHFTVQIETAGSFWLPVLDRKKVEIVVSPKTKMVHPRIMAGAVAWKYVVSMDSRTKSIDGKGLPVLPTQRPLGRNRQRHGVPKQFPFGRDKDVFLSPCWIPEDPWLTKQNIKKVAEIALKHGYRAGLQAHKHWGVPQ